MLTPDIAQIHTFEVVPAMPDALAPLMEIAFNLWWSWHPEAVALFMRLDARLWQQVQHNPVRMLGAIDQEKLDAAARDEVFLNALAQVRRNLARHMERMPWLKRINRDPGQAVVAYFCAEYGLTECLQIYSGGLGCLAGDHLKSASELGLPFVAVGLLYRHGYFQQYLNSDGWQQEYYPDLDFSNLPVRPVRDDQGRQVTVSVHLPGRDVLINVWQVLVGQVPLYLLDTNHPDNDDADRRITAELYGGDMETRIKQEIVLGIGGVRALNALGIDPDVCHMNEGHSAFLALERIRHRIERFGLTFDEARQQASASHVFTTHTPVPAGIDRFPTDMIQRYFKPYHESLRLDMEGLLALGRENVFNKREAFSMAVLALRTSDWCNAVSRLHGRVSRNMWNKIWPNVPQDEVPITHVTNGVHARSWLSKELSNTFDHYLGDRWFADPADHQIWNAIHQVPDEELWRVHQLRRARLIEWTKRRLRAQLERRETNPQTIREACDALNPDALTIGFARRFATYKRGTLLMRDRDRLIRLLEDAGRPVQFLFAGKAHPADSGGKDLIRQVVRFARESNVGHHIVFLENYDIEVARYLVQGCDVWLNTPRRGMEASGTSGMKAALNGGLNCSILDGWWDEAYEGCPGSVGADEAFGFLTLGQTSREPDVGWAIGRGEHYTDPDTADDLESQALYDLLEQAIIPLFYKRDDQGVPREWVAMMKQCIARLAPVFNTNRMVQEYTQKLYLPALDRARKLAEDDLQRSAQLAHQKVRLRKAWYHLKIDQVMVSPDRPLAVGQPLTLDVMVDLGELTPEEVRVQGYTGRRDNDGRITQGHAFDLTYAQHLDGSRHRFTGSIDARDSGKHGLAVRIVPGGEMFNGVLEPGLMHWEGKTPKPAPEGSLIAEKTP